MSQGARISSVMRYSSTGWFGSSWSQQCPHALDTRDRALAKAPGAVVQLHLPAHRLPLRLRDAGGDAAVCDDLDHPVRHERVDQDTVVVRRVPHAELSEQLQRALPRRQIEGGLDGEAELPGMMRFAAADGLFDGVANLRREVPARAPACGRGWR